jgi:hypothetical protein
VAKIRCFCGKEFHSVEEWKAHYLKDTMKVTGLYFFRNEANVPTCLFERKAEETVKKECGDCETQAGCPFPTPRPNCR